MIYRARYILPMDGRVIENGEVRVRDGAIEAVGPRGETAPEDSVTDLGAAAILPGFVNAHSHLDYTLQRNVCDGLNLWDWIHTVGYRWDKTPRYETFLASATLGAAECACSGVTCLGDSTYSAAAAEAIASVGLRGIAYREVFGQHMGDAWRERFAQALDHVAELRTRVSPLVDVGISPHAVYTTRANVLELCAAVCGGNGLPIAVHLAETQAEVDYCLTGTGPLAEWRRRLGYEPMVSGLTPARLLEKTGLLREGVCLAHCVHLAPDEVELVAQSGASVAHCPRSNGYLGAGVAPLLSFLSAGIPTGLGTDSAASCIRLDFFEEIRFALALHRAVAEDATVLTAKNVLELATIGGARALNLDDSIGTLEPGKRADLVAVDLRTMLPEEDVHLAVLGRSPADVLLVLVDGAEVVRDGTGVRFDVEECRKQLVSAMEQAEH